MRGVLLAVLLALPAVAQEPFELAISGGVSGDCVTLPYAEELHVQWLKPYRRYAHSVAAIDSADGHTVFGVLDGSPLRVARITPDNAHVPFFTDTTLVSDSVIAVARNGRVFVLTFDALYVISPAGALERAYALLDARDGHQSPFISVAPDNCTVFYGKPHGAAGRTNGCTGEALPDFLPPSYVADVRALSTGDVLVATDAAVVLYSAAGVRLREVARVNEGGGIDRLAVAGDERSVWLAVLPGCGEPGRLIRVALDDGRELDRRLVWMDRATGFVAGAHADAAIPAAGPAALIALAATLALAALFLLKR